ncbi:MAG: putative Ig domain-containing protein [Acidobacteriota bacterium]
MSSLSARVVLVSPGADVKEALPDRAAGQVSGLPASPPMDPDATQSFIPEVEPNGTPQSATPLSGSNLVALGNLYPVGDFDFYSFTATAGDHIYTSTMTAFSPTGGSHDTILALIATNGSTVIESDDDNGEINDLASSIAGAVIPASGTYYLRVRGYPGVVRPVTPYQLHLRIQSGSPAAETEPNDDTPTANPLPPSGWVQGTVSTGADVDTYSLALNAGDTVVIGLDLDPERDSVAFNGRTGFGLVGGQFLGVNDGGTADTIPSEAYFMTVRDAGTYYVFVDAASGAGATATYNLSVSVHARTAACTTYTSTDVPKVIPDLSTVTSTLIVPGAARAGDVSVHVQLDHTSMPDLDVNLVSPRGNDNGLFVDCGDPAFTTMDAWFGDEAGFPIRTDDGNGGSTPLSPVVDGIFFQIDHDYRMAWFDGELAAGTWTLRLADDSAGGTGNLTGWAMQICPYGQAPPCGVGTVQQVAFATDFEANNGGFTHSGTADEWEWGTPTFPPIDTANSGVRCWKTDLDNTYDLSSTQDLLSPPIDLTAALSARMQWAQKFQMEGASFDHAYLEAREVGGANPRKLWEFMDGTMHTTQGTSVVQESAGWGLVRADLSAYAGKMIELRFHLDSDNIQNFAGYAIDDVNVFRCVCAAITLNPALLPGGVAGTPYSQTITASGGAPPYTYSVTAGALPPGLALNAATGVLNGTPSATGTFTFTVTATDSNGCTGSRNYTVTISCGTIVIAPASLPTGTLGGPYNQSLSSSGGLGPYTYSVTGGALPPGLSLSAAGVLSGTPTVRGTFTFTVTSTDSAGCKGTRIYTIAIYTKVNYLAGAGLGPPNPNQVRIFNTATPPQQQIDFLAYNGGAYGCNVAAGDVNAGNYDEILTGPGPGTTYGPQVRGFDNAGVSMGKINFYAYGTLRYGVNVGSANVDGDVYDEILTGPGPGPVFGPQVRGWNFDNSQVLPINKINFYAYGTLRYGVNVSSGNVDGDGYDEMLTGPGPGTVFGAQVRGWNYDNVQVTSINKINFVAFAGLLYGANVASGDVDADGFAEILCTPGPGPANPTRFLGFNFDNTIITPLQGFDVTPVTTMYGGRVGSGDITMDRKSDLVCGAGRDPAADSTVRAYDYVANALVPIGAGFQAFTGLTYGVNATGMEAGY